MSTCKRVACGIPREDGVSSGLVRILPVMVVYTVLQGVVLGEAGKVCWDANTTCESAR